MVAVFIFCFVVYDVIWFVYFVEEDEGKDMVGGGAWRWVLPNLRVRPSGGEKTPEKYYCP